MTDAPTSTEHQEGHVPWNTSRQEANMIGQEKNRRRADGQRQMALSSIAHIPTTVIDLIG